MMAATVDQQDVETIRSTVSSITLEKGITVLVTLAVGLVVAYLLSRLFARLLNRSRIDKTLHSFLRSLIRILLYMIVILVTLGTLGLNVTSLVAVLSVVSLAITLAVQGTLANIAGCIQILSAHPFAVGDYVEVGGVEGTVKEISMIYTRLVTLDNKSVYLPNSDVASAKVSNYTVEGRRRITLPISASYDCPTEPVLQALRQAALGGGALADPAPKAYVRSYDDSAIRYELFFWCEPRDYWPTYYAVTAAVREEFDKADLIMTYPHLNVHLDQPVEPKHDNSPATYQISPVE